MSLTFPLPFKVDNQAIWQSHTLKFCNMYPSVATLSFANKSNCSMNKAKNNFIEVHLFHLLYLLISVNMAVVQKENSTTLVCDAGVDK